MITGVLILVFQRANEVGPNLTIEHLLSAPAICAENAQAVDSDSFELSDRVPVRVKCFCQSGGLEFDDVTSRD